MPLVLKIVLSIVSTLLGIMGLIIGYKCYKNGCLVKRLVPSFRKHKKQKTFKRSTSGTQYIAEYQSGWTQAKPLRSSVTIREVEMQPLTSPRPQCIPNQVNRGPPAIEAATSSDKTQALRQTSIPATPESVAKALEDTTGINFDKYYKKKKQRAATTRECHL